MVKEILYTTAIDKSGNLIHAGLAQKGLPYYCPMCKKEFILRKSGNIGKGSKRPHFAHNEITPNCTPEGVLHYAFKKMLITLLERNKAVNIPFILNWNCDACFNRNSGNLLEKVTYIKEEYTLGASRPDIALIDIEGNVIAVIEIVVTHKPEDSILQYYKEKKIVLIQIFLSSVEDLNKVEEKTAYRDIVDFCLNPKCQNSNHNKTNRKIKIHHDQCVLCLYPIEKYYLMTDSVFGKKETMNFTENEINLVKSKRRNIDIETNQTTKEIYPVFICLNSIRLRSRHNRFRL
jgi:hypothetical protein